MYSETKLVDRVIVWGRDKQSLIANIILPAHTYVGKKKEAGGSVAVHLCASARPIDHSSDSFRSSAPGLRIWKCKYILYVLAYKSR